MFDLNRLIVTIRRQENFSWKRMSHETLGETNMRIEFGLKQEQSQKLVITPELRTAIKILQFSALELAEYVDEQLVENPVLEVEEESEINHDTVSIEKEVQDPDEANFDWEQYFQHQGEIRNEGTLYQESESWRTENLTPQVSTLDDHLMFQLSLLHLDKKEEVVGKFLIGNIDDNGYLTCSMEDAARQCRVDHETVEKVLKMIQGFDPPGIGARSLKECLLIQCEYRGFKNDLLSKIINSYLQEVADGRIMKVAKKLGVSLKEMQEAVDTLRLLEPKPGRRFAGSHGSHYIIPDILVEKVGSEFVVLVNDITTPRLSINSFYRDMLKSSNPDNEGRKYIESKMNSAVWLLKSIEQRRLTLYRVARCLVDFQTDFLNRGIKFLKPLTLKQVAEELGVHESTVSRATANKYMQTPRGVFELKFFFSTGVSGNQGDATSAAAVKKMIRELIESEDPKKPLSDQKIVDLLQEKGIEISRRTIAKYREEMGISATSKRRRY